MDRRPTPRTFPLAVLLLAGVSCASSASPAVLVGTAMPHVGVVGVDGKPTDLEEVRHGRPALVSFWATWCVACREEFDALNRLDDKAKKDGAVVIGVAVGEAPTVAGPFADRHALHYAQLVDENFALADALGQREIPATIVVDRAGKIVFSGGTLDEPALAAFRAAVADAKR